MKYSAELTDAPRIELVHKAPEITLSETTVNMFNQYRPQIVEALEALPKEDYIDETIWAVKNDLAYCLMRAKRIQYIIKALANHNLPVFNEMLSHLLFLYYVAIEGELNEVD